MNSNLATIMDALSHFHFLRPWWLLSIVPLFIFYRSMLKQDDPLKQWRGHMSEKMIKHLTLADKKQQLVNPKNLFVVFAIISTLIMAGPSWRQTTSPFFVDQSVLVVALDVSESMHNDDIQPSRLLRAKQKINALLDKRGDAKTALVVYAGSAHVAMPVTKDKEMIRHFLDVLDTKLLPVKDSRPESVVAPVIKLLNQTDTPSTLLLLTDKTNSTAINEFKQYFETQPHQMLVWAMGENPDSGLTTSSGLSANALSELTQLASAGNGEMVPFTHNEDDIYEVNHDIKNNLESSEDEAMPWLDEGYFLLFLLIPLQALWFRRGWTMQW